MRLLDSIRFRIATLFRRAEMNANMEEELRSLSLAKTPSAFRINRMAH
jgi:hypothetical protein